MSPLGGGASGGLIPVLSLGQRTKECRSHYYRHLRPCPFVAFSHLYMVCDIFRLLSEITSVILTLFQVLIIFRTANSVSQSVHNVETQLSCHSQGSSSGEAAEDVGDSGSSQSS